MEKPAMRQQNKPLLMATKLAERRPSFLCAACDNHAAPRQGLSLRQGPRDRAWKAGVTVISYCLTIKSQG